MRKANIQLLSIYIAILSMYPMNLFAQTSNPNEADLKIERVPLIQIRITGNDNALPPIPETADGDTSYKTQGNKKTKVYKSVTKEASQKDTKNTTQSANKADDAAGNNTPETTTVSEAATPKKPTDKKSPVKKTADVKSNDEASTAPTAAPTSAGTPQTNIVVPQGMTTITNHTVNTVTYNITNNVINSEDGNGDSSATITMPVKPNGKTPIRPLKTPPNIVKSAPSANGDDNGVADQSTQPTTTVIVVPAPTEITPQTQPNIVPAPTNNQSNNGATQSAQHSDAVAPMPVPAETPAPATSTTAPVAPTAPAAQTAPVTPAPAAAETPAPVTPTEPTAPESTAPAAETPAEAPAAPDDSTTTAPAQEQTPAANDNVDTSAAPATDNTPPAPATPIGEQIAPQSNNGALKNIAYTAPAFFDKRYMQKTVSTAADQHPRMIKTADTETVAAAVPAKAATEKKTDTKPVKKEEATVKATPADSKASITSTTAAPADASQKKTVKKNESKSAKVTKTAQESKPDSPMAPYKPKIEQPPQPYGLWIKTTKGAGKRPTIIALHGCGGLYSSYGNDPKLTPRHETMARVFTSIGFNVLFPDLFMPRGIYGNCTDSLSEWTKTSEADRKSVETSLEWLATQPNVDMNRIVLFGWSYGATVMLNALNLAHTDVAVRNIQPKAAVAFYPYCEPYLDSRKPYKLAAPTEIFVGENDTWTPAKACERFEERLLDSETQVNVFTYPDTYHDFDAPGTPIYVRLDVNPADGKPGGITAGGNSISRAAAYKEILSFLKDKLQ